jgi:tetratricopeptide (TPR) repeat protein
MIGHGKSWAGSGFLIVAFFLITVGSSFAQQSDDGATQKGLDYSKKAMYDEAIIEFTRAIVSNPGNAIAYYNRGLAYHKNHKPAEALSDYTRAIELDPANAEIYYNKGIIRYSNGNLLDAVSDWSKAIEISPKQAAIYQKRAAAYCQLQEYGKAWDDVHKIDELGSAVDPGFLEKLKKSSGREK